MKIQMVYFTREITFSIIIILLILAHSLSARQAYSIKTYYVATTGSDQNPGTFAEPFRTIQKAAFEMKPGDTCLVRSGVYRECIKPPRGGISENHRITYMAYPGETPVIKGSERITNWQSQGNDIWMAELPDSFFGDFNPYQMHIYGDLISKYKMADTTIWLEFGQEYHLGDVYNEGVPFVETLKKEEMISSAKTWYTESTQGITRIWAHFDNGNPNEELSEINVRECVFFPELPGLKYITVSGFTLQQAACYWAPPNSFQKGLIGTHFGKSWIIQNCHITDAKCVGICSGNIYGRHSLDIEQIGHHIVRNNIIERCGEAGITGLTGFAASLIENNLIQDINYKMQFGGQETAGIKVHMATDLVIKDNIIRRVFAKGNKEATNSHFPGIWIDWSNQGIRITGNVVYSIVDYAIYVEANHGPLLIDNNVIIDSPVGSESERVILAHNLFFNSGLMYMNRETRNPGYYKPHTLEEIDEAFINNIEDRYYNNIFIGKGSDRLHIGFPTSFMSSEPQNAKDFRSGYNLYYQEINGQLLDKTGIANADFQSDFKIQEFANGLELSFLMDESAFKLKCPLVDTTLIGNFSFVDQGMEQHDGSPIIVDLDFFGNKRSTIHPQVGPFEKLKPGLNLFTVKAGSRTIDSVLP
jgi:hypothetical protein